MSTSISFTGSAFTVNNATQTAQNTVRVSFSQPPLASSAAGVNDSLNPNNYSLTGPSVTAVISVELTGTLEVTLTLAAPLVAGLWTIVLTNIKNDSAVTITPNPSVLNFQATDVFTQPPLGLGALNRDSEEALKRHSGIFNGKTNWDALWAALGGGDDINSELAQNVYEQLFPSLADGSYLRERASDDGILLPHGIGLSDDTVRKIVLRIKNNKLTLQSFLDVLNAFYSDKKTRAFITSDFAEPYALVDQETLIIEIDGDRVETVFNSDSFTNIGAATSEEVANALNAQFSRLNLRCVARADFDILTQNTHVSIFSGALGLKGYIKVLGGLAQKGLSFPDTLLTTQDATTVWTLTQQTQPGLFRVTSPSGTAPSFNLLELNDYIVLTSTNSSLVNRGSFTIVEVGSTYFDIENKKGADQTFTQDSVDGVLFFRPTKYDLNKIDLPAFASQYSTATDVILPATVNLDRDYDDATYLGSDASYQKTFLVNDSKVAIDNYVRTANVLTINTATDHGLAVGEKFLFSPGSASIAEQEFVVVSTPTADSLTAASVGADFGTITPDYLYVYKNYKNDSGNLVLHITDPDNFIVDSFAQATNLLGDIDPAEEELVVGTDPVPVYAENVARIQIDNIVYFGASGATDWFKYDLLTNTLTTLTSIPDGTIGAKSMCKVHGMDKIFAMVGATSWLYDISQDQWTPNVDSSIGWGFPYVTALPNGQVFVFGNASNSNPAQVYDIGSGIWYNIGLGSALQNPENTVPAVSNNGKVLISHGVIGGSPNPDTILLDTYERAYIQVPSHGEAGREDPSIIWHPKLGKFIVSGGIEAAVVTPVIKTFDPQTMLWDTLTTNGPELYDHNTHILNDNEIAFTSGEDSTFQPNAFIYVYNFLTDELTQYPLSFHRNWIAAHYNGWWMTIWNTLPIVLARRFYNKNTMANNFENDYRIGSVDGNSVTLEALFTSELTNNFSPIKAPFLNHLGEEIYPTVSLVRDSSDTGLNGSYLLDKTVPISEFVFNLDQNIESGTSYNSLTFTTIPTNMPSSGFLMIGYGTQYQTGPIEFFEKTSSTTLKVDGNFTFLNSIPSGEGVVYAYSSQPLDAIDHSAYIVNPSVVRLYAKELISSIKASGSDINIDTVYPDDFGLGNSDNRAKVSDAIYIWGTQEDLDKER